MLRRSIRQLVPRRYRMSTLLHAQILKRCRGHVYQGPFRGMAWPAHNYAAVWSPKILGTYELELAASLQRFLENDIDTAVVVGGAEGYYAVGLASQDAVKRVVAFEPSPDARRVMADMAQRNAVASKLAIKSVCDMGSLRTSLAAAPNSFLVMDIEGGEAILLDPSEISPLKKIPVMVELHEFAVPGVSDLIRQRFEDTHDIDEIRARPRRVADFPLTMKGWRRRLMEGAAIQAMAEYRPPGMAWFVMTPHVT